MRKKWVQAMCLEMCLNSKHHFVVFTDEFRKKNPVKIRTLLTVVIFVLQFYSCMLSPNNTQLTLKIKKIHVFSRIKNFFRGWDLSVRGRG